MAGDHFGLYFWGGLIGLCATRAAYDSAKERFGGNNHLPAKSIAEGITVQKTLGQLHCYAFPTLVSEVFKRDHPELTPSQCDLAFEGLREFFMLLAASGDGRDRVSLGMPSVLVDGAWHAFVLCTAEYEAFCHRFFRRMIHHRPDPNAQPTTMDANSHFSRETMNTWSAFQTAKRRHTTLFRTSSNGFPMLFETDRIAGVPFGWIWTDQALFALELAVRRSTRDTTSTSDGGPTGYPDASPSTSESNASAEHHHSGGHSCASDGHSGGHSCSSGSSCGSSCSSGSSGGD
jgi:hypothetical protein